MAPKITEKQRLMVAPILREELAKVQERLEALADKTHWAHGSAGLLAHYQAKEAAIKATLELLIDASA